MIRFKKNRNYIIHYNGVFSKETKVNNGNIFHIIRFWIYYWFAKQLDKNKNVGSIQIRLFDYKMGYENLLFYEISFSNIKRYIIVSRRRLIGCELIQDIMVDISKNLANEYHEIFEKLVYKIYVLK